jgi:cytochrome P450
MTDSVSLFRRFNRECGAIGRLRVLGASLVLVNAPELLHEMLIDKARSFRKPLGMLAPARPLVGEGLSTSDGELWHRQRRLMAPLFTHAQSAQYVDCMAACARSSALELEGGHLVDVAREMTRITMRIAGKTLFDAELLDEADELGAALTLALRWVDEQTGSIPWAARLRAFSALERVAPRLPEPLRGRSRALAQALVEPSRRSRCLGEGRREVDEALATIERRVARMISERRARGLSRPDLLSRLLGARDEHGEAMSDRQVRDEIVTLFIAGHETTATALAWSFCLLGRHPEAHDRARAPPPGGLARSRAIQAIPLRARG